MGCSSLYLPPCAKRPGNHAQHKQRGALEVAPRTKSARAEASRARAFGISASRLYMRGGPSGQQNLPSPHSKPMKRSHVEPIEEAEAASGGGESEWE